LQLNGKAFGRLEEDLATLREYFDTDVKQLCSQTEWNTQDQTGKATPSVAVKAVLDLDANAKHLRFFIPAGANPLSYTNMILASSMTERCLAHEEGDLVSIRSGFADYLQMDSKTLVFTRRLFLYIDSDLTAADRNHLVQLGNERGFHLVVFDREFANKRSKMERPLAFISHDSRDKDTLVRELAGKLVAFMCPVWYDEYSLKVGDSLRANIEKGLKETRKCVVVLSPNFLSNEGWSKAEFDSIYAREIIEKKNVILPVWHGVKKEDVYAYCPRLVDRFALDSSVGISALADKLSAVIRHEDGQER